MKTLAEFSTLFVGILVYILLRPYLGLVAFLVGAIVAFVIRPTVYALFGVSIRTQLPNEQGDKKEDNDETAQ